MSEEPQAPQGTPPHHPTYNVFFSNSHIEHLVRCALSSSKVLKIEQLPSGKSFNNRIYFVRILSSKDVLRNIDPAFSVSRSEKEPDAVEMETVLKVSGQFFGPDKVENEVACLYMMEKHCPNVPSPRVIAWSPDGIVYKKLTRSTTVNKDGHAEESIMTTEPGQFRTDNSSLPLRSWILMSRQPGRLLNPKEDLNGPNGSNLMKQLANFMKTWRTNIALGSHKFGNLRLETPHADDQDDKGGSRLSVSIDGLLLCHYGPENPLASKRSYFEQRLHDSLSKLEKEDVFASEKRLEVSRLVRAWMNQNLSGLSLVSSLSGVDQAPKFTHYDLSPRNILVSSDEDDRTNLTGSEHFTETKITGLLDFEFAGFFPEEEEFTNNSIANEGDWPKASYDIFLEELQRLGVRTPQDGRREVRSTQSEGEFPERQWKEACLLSNLIEDLAPWNLREGGVKGEQLKRELMSAAAKVEQTIRGLKECAVQDAF